MNSTSVFDIISAHPAMVEFNLESLISVPFGTDNLDAGNYDVMFVGVIFTISVLARLVFGSYYPIAHFPFMLVFGFSCGVMMKHLTVFKSFTGIANLSYSVTLAIFAPLLVFHCAYRMDYNSLTHYMGHILLLSFLGVIVHCGILTFLSFPVLSLGYNWDIGSIFGLSIVLAPLFVDITVSNLHKVQGRVKPLQLILQGEQLLTMAIAFYIHSILIKLASMESTPFAIILGVSGWKLLSVFVGLIIGLIVRYPFKFAYNDVITQVTLGIGTLYLSYYIATILGMCGPLAVVFFGLMLSSTKMKNSQETELYTNNLWDYILFITNTVIYVLAGVQLGYNEHMPHIYDIGYIILLYILCLLSRILVYTIVSPLLRTTGPILSWKNLVVAVWGVYRGSGSLLMAVLFAAYYQNDFGYRVLVYTVSIIVFSLFLNAFLTKLLLGMLGLYDLSKAKRVNMNMAISHINLCRENVIFALKLDRVIADANWLVVENLTRISHPYRRKNQKKGTFDENFGEDLHTFRVLSCPDCGGHTLCPPTDKEIEDMTDEAKHRVLKAQLVSFWQQYDMGVLTRRGVRVLSNLVDTATIKENPMLRAADLKINPQGPYHLRFLKLALGQVLVATSKTHHYIPTDSCRSLCFQVCASRCFQILMAVIAMTDVFVLIYLTILYYFTSSYDDHEAFAFFAQILDFICFFTSLVEFWLQVMGIGFVQFFRGHVNKIEFAIGLMIRGCEITMYSHTAFDQGKMVNCLKTDDIILFLKTMLLFRAIRLYIFWTALIPKLLNYVDRQLDEELMKIYDIGKGFLVGHDRIMKYLGHVVNNEKVYNSLKTTLEADRLAVTRELGLIQKDRPAIATTMKSRHAINQIINTMADCVNDLKEKGLLDEVENKQLIASVDLIKKKLRDIAIVNPCPPDYILREIPWLYGDHDTANFLLLHSKLSTYDANDVIIRFGDDPVGVYIIVSGLVKSYYRPAYSVLEQSNKYGLLPNYDFFTNLKFDTPQEEFVVSGNVIGEIGLVTGRRYDMEVICETAVQLYYVPWRILKAVIHDNDDAERMQCKLWKAIGIKIGVHLLQHSKHFQGWLHEKLLFYLQRAVVPILGGVSCLSLNETIVDVILIEGVIMDAVSKAIFYGPFYVPRNIHKIILPDNPQWSFETNYETRLLIIPDNNAEQNDIVGPNGIFKDHYKLLQKRAQTNVSEGDDDPTRKCLHGHDSNLLDTLSSQRLAQRSRGMPKKVGFIDYIPNIRGIDDASPPTTFVMHPSAKDQLRSATHPRKIQGSSIHFVKDIEEQSERGSIVLNVDRVSDSSFEKDMVLLKAERKAKIKARRQDRNSLKSKKKWWCCKGKADAISSKEKPIKKKYSSLLGTPMRRISEPKISPDNAEQSRGSFTVVKLKTFEVKESEISILKGFKDGKSVAIQTSLQAKRTQLVRQNSLDATPTDPFSTLLGLYGMNDQKKPDRRSERRSGSSRQSRDSLPRDRSFDRHSRVSETMSIVSSSSDDDDTESKDGPNTPQPTKHRPGSLSYKRRLTPRQHF